MGAFEHCSNCVAKSGRLAKNALKKKAGENGNGFASAEAGESKNNKKKKKNQNFKSKKSPFKMGQQFSVSFFVWLRLLLFSFFEPNKTPPSVRYINVFFVFKPFVWPNRKKIGKIFGNEKFFCCAANVFGMQRLQNNQFVFAFSVLICGNCFFASR